MGSSLITPEDVLGTLMNDGIIDNIRLKIINQLKANEELKNNTITMVEQSKVLNTPGAEKQTKRELFDALRRELETPVLEKASKAVWELILDNNGLGKEISDTVERIYCRLSGREQQIEDRDEKEKAETSEPSSRKRTFVEMNGQANLDGPDQPQTDGSDLPQPPVVSDDGAETANSVNPNDAKLT